MRTHRAVLIGAVLGLMALVGGGLWLVTHDPDLRADGSATEGVEGGAAQTPSGRKSPSGRRRSGRTGDAAVHGRVVRGQDRDLAAGVTVTLARPGLGDWIATTDDGGVFRFVELPSGGPYAVTASADDCATVSVPGIVLGERDERDVGVLRLDVGVSAVVEVRGSADAPVSGARVEAFAPQAASGGRTRATRVAEARAAPVAVARATTGADGLAHFPALAVGRYTFRATADAYATGGVRSQELQSREGAHELTIRLYPGHGVSGRVLDRHRKPVAGALVLAMGASGPLHKRSITDDDGGFRLDGLDVGRTRIRVAAPGELLQEVMVIHVPSVEFLEIVLRPVARLSGTVTLEETGEPVGGAIVRVTARDGSVMHRAEGVSDAEGRYVIETFFVGKIERLSVDKPGYVIARDPGDESSSRKLRRGDRIACDVRLRAETVLIGVVRGPGGPLSGAHVNVYYPGREWKSQPAGATTGADGSYRLGSLDAGTALLVTYAAEHYAPKCWEYWRVSRTDEIPEEWSVDLPASGEVTRDVRLARSEGVVVGHVLSQDGEPLTGALVNVWAPFRRRAPITTDDEGAFRLDRLPSSTELFVYADADGFGRGYQTVRVVSGRLYEALRRVAALGLIEIDAFVFLTTHFHLLVRSLTGEISLAMKLVTNEFVRWFNRAHKRDGPLFDGRRIDDGAFWKEALRYIDLNPVRAKMCALPSDHPYGSARAHRFSEGPQWLTRSRVTDTLADFCLPEVYAPHHYDHFACAVDPDVNAYLVEHLARYPERVAPPLTDLIRSASLRQQGWTEWKAALADGTQIGTAFLPPAAARRAARVAARLLLRGGFIFVTQLTAQGLYAEYVGPVRGLVRRQLGATRLRASARDAGLGVSRHASTEEGRRKCVLSRSGRFCPWSEHSSSWRSLRTRRHSSNSSSIVPRRPRSKYTRPSAT